MQTILDSEGGPYQDMSEFGNRAADFLNKHRRKLGPLLLGIAALAVLLSGVYVVGPGEIGVVRTFGRESGRSYPGLHYRIPFIQQADVVNVEKIRRIEVGFRGKERLPHESLMLTGDENIVDAQMIVQYRVSDPSKFLFRLRDPEEVLHTTAQVALRGKVGETTIDDVITTAREKVQDETRQWLQQLMDKYQSGLTITEVKLLVVDAPDEVKEAFHDVVRAREEKEKLINQAMGYKADRIPRARGEARKIERDAEAYKEQRVLRARGDAARFEALLAEYRNAVGVTRERLYLEMMERILSRLENKIFVDKDIARGALPVLPLGGLGTLLQRSASEGGK
ncbi:MAG: FtsH protease activity modulator HflK [Myxococcales bacterium]|nr:FtsH protease activity modulator HflK [Myxococcota bacterium]MDW8281538.1 FtsH protease activity modulator HflK [Myxococcales bacterium]